MKCSKKSFKSFKRAEDVALKLSVENKDIGHPELRPYRCSICKKWHITSDTKNKTKSQEINLKRERDFIRQESEYWENYFNK